MSYTYEQIRTFVENASDEDLMHYFTSFQVTITKEKLVDLLRNTYDDLRVGDMIFESFDLKGKEFKYPTYMIDELVLEIAKREQFPFQHYGIWLENYKSNHPKTYRIKYQELQEFIKMAKATNLHNFDEIIFKIEDGKYVLEAFLNYFDEVYKQRKSLTREDLTKTIQLFDSFILQFSNINETIEEEIRLSALPILSYLDGKKAQRMVQEALSTTMNKEDWIVTYLLSTPKESNSYAKNWGEKILRQERLRDEERREIEKVIKRL